MYRTVCFSNRWYEVVNHPASTIFRQFLDFFRIYKCEHTLKPIMLKIFLIFIHYLCMALNCQMITIHKIIPASIIISWLSRSLDSVVFYVEQMQHNTIMTKVWWMVQYGFCIVGPKIIHGDCTLGWRWHVNQTSI